MRNFISDEVINKFAKKKTKSYDFLLKAGNNFKESIYRLCRKMILNEHFPHGFRKTVLFMIWKQKAPAEVLSNNRFIHMKDGYLPRTCEALVVNKMKDKLIKSSSKYQVGGQPGHSPEEHIYSIKSLWAKLEAEGAGMILTLVDIVAFFDRENIYDVMQTLSDIGVNKKAARVWFKLDEGTKISVKTAAGMSDIAHVSQVNLDQGLDQYFGDGGEDLDYGKVQVKPLAYQDDIMKGSKDVMGAQTGNIKLAAMLKDKGLDAHPDKTCFLVCGSKTFKEKAQKELEGNPLMFDKFPVKQKVSDK